VSTEKPQDKPSPAVNSSQGHAAAAGCGFA
jgi:hypothetical protein